MTFDMFADLVMFFLHGEGAAETVSQTATLLAELTVFVLAIFIGFELITKVPPTLHTPLMSGANAISGITIVGALLCVATDKGLLANILGLFAVATATTNVVGGFMVTNRMLVMFNKKGK